MTRNRTEYMREYRLKNHEKVLAIKKRSDAKNGYGYQKLWQLSHPERFKAQLQVKYALKMGRLVKGVCVECGSTETVAHHPDYSKPLEVIWLCRSHHRASHYGDTPRSLAKKKPSKNANNNLTGDK